MHVAKGEDSGLPCQLHDIEWKLWSCVHKCRIILFIINYENNDKSIIRIVLNVGYTKSCDTLGKVIYSGGDKQEQKQLILIW